jgi:organic hydroperoxide reductase OsmC/OhrA
MQPLPHHYSVTALASTAPDVILEAECVESMRSNTPLEFDGPGDRWSPETLLVAAVADCFVLTFRGIARASRLPWTSLTCDVVGALDRVDGVTQFTQFDVDARLLLPDGTSEALAHRLLVKAEDRCLIARSLKAATTLRVSIESASPMVVAS